MQALLVYIIMSIVTSQPPREGESVGTRGQQQKKLGGGGRGRWGGGGGAGLSSNVNGKEQKKNALTSMT